MSSAGGGRDHEALRQQMLVRALWGDARPGAVGGWMRDGARFERGLRAYRAHAGALAERALGAAFPTVAQLLGDGSFAKLARAFWHADAPQRGDIAQWGAALPEFVAADAQLADLPYLADVARLDWAVHRAEQAADGGGAAQGLPLLGAHDPAALRLALAPGTALLASAYPVVTLYHAHRSQAADRFAPAREALAAGRAETALVRRCGWAAAVSALDVPGARFTAALLAPVSLAQALADAGDDFAFEPWLIEALQTGLLDAVVAVQTPQSA